jgi:peptidoglycan/xylan/chitin deacetylase (PgdA/CDA1 family)
MKWLTAVLVLAWVAVSGSRAQSQSPSVTIARWPGDRVAAISLTFDDAMKTQLDNVGPILKKHHLTGTFFVTTGKSDWSDRKKEWQQLAADGNEIGNHTVNHPCLLKEIVPHSQSYTPEMMEAEVKGAAEEIAKTIPSHRGLTFAYPCGNMSFGPTQDRTRNQALFVTYVSRYSFAARGYGAGGPESPEEMNILAIPDLGPTVGKDFSSLLEMAKPAISGKNWGVFCFHGVGGEWLSIKTGTLDELAGYFEQHPEIWTAPLGDVVRYIQERDALQSKIKQYDDGSFDVLLSWPLEKQVYDLPLTLRIEMPSEWKTASATVNGKPLTTLFRHEDKGQIVLVNIGPATEAVHLSSTNH